MQQNDDDGARGARDAGARADGGRAAGDRAREAEGPDGSAPDGLDALWLMAALDPERLAEELGAERSAAFLADPRNAAEIAGLQRFLGEVRTGLTDERRVAHARAARRVTRRVLARTTREELGWRGDLRLVGDFVVDRLRASPWLRFAAAALFVQVTVVPILAWHILREPNAGAFNLHWEQRAAPPDLAAEDTESELEIESPALDPTLPVLPIEEVAPVLRDLGRRVCAEYGRGRVPEQSADEVLASGHGPHAGATEWALANRALGLASGGSREPATHAGIRSSPEGLPVVGQPSLQRLVQLEQALDRRALLGHAADLSMLLDELGGTLVSGPAGSLAAAVQRRAAALQVVAYTAPVPGDERPTTVLVPGKAYGEALASALAGEDVAASGPWARAWLTVLAEPR